MRSVKIRRALLTVFDKEGIVDLARALHQAGAEIVATGRTALVIQDAGIPITPIEKVSGSPEAFQGRMKTLSFPVCSGILYRRGDASDEKDLARLNVLPIDCVVVNFYPFEKAAQKPGISEKELIEEIDIGGPTMVRAAAKNAPDVLVLTSPRQYVRVIEELKTDRAVSVETSNRCASEAWDRVFEYDSAIAERMGSSQKMILRYGENPHQTGLLEYTTGSPIEWNRKLTTNELSYNNILDLTAAYSLASDLTKIAPRSAHVVIVKHNNPCGVAVVNPDRNATGKSAQLVALELAWQGDPVSAFGGVLVFAAPLEKDTAMFLSERFVELIGAPGLHQDSPELLHILTKRKKLKAVNIVRFAEMPAQTAVNVPGGRLIQSADLGYEENFKSVTKKGFDEKKTQLAHFGIFVCRALKSNAIALVREVQAGGPADTVYAFQLVGAGQGQPNRIEALKQLAVPRAIATLGDRKLLSECVMVSDAFFPFRDTVDTSAEAGIRYIVQPGGSIKDQESIDACDEHGVAMAFTGVRHFKH